MDEWGYVYIGINRVGNSQMHYMIDGKLVSSKTIVNYTTEAFNEAG